MPWITRVFTQTIYSCRNCGKELIVEIDHKNDLCDRNAIQRGWLFANNPTNCRECEVFCSVACLKNIATPLPPLEGRISDAL